MPNKNKYNIYGLFLIGGWWNMKDKKLEDAK